MISRCMAGVRVGLSVGVGQFDVVGMFNRGRIVWEGRPNCLLKCNGNLGVYLEDGGEAELTYHLYEGILVVNDPLRRGKQYCLTPLPSSCPTRR